MNDIDITLYFNEDRMNALDAVLAGQDTSTEEKLMEAFQALYEEYVPAEKRAKIENKIQMEIQKDAEEAEAARRFAVVHLHEDGDDFHFTTELRSDFYSAASLYRNYLKDDVGKLTLDSIGCKFSDADMIDDRTFSILCSAMPNDEHITSLLEFDFENNVLSVKEKGDEDWRAYNLKDVSTAVYRAERKSGLRWETRCEIFEEALHGKELDLSLNSAGEDESEAPAMQM